MGLLKVLYIRSGYIRIYQYLDDSIISAWKEIGNVDVTIVKTPKLDTKLFIQKIMKSKPDLIMTLLGDHLSQPILEWMKNSSIPTVLWLTEDPYYIDRSLEKIPYFDFIFTIDAGALEYYKKVGFRNIYFLPLATNPAIYHDISPLKYRQYCDLCMVGYPYPERVKLIKLLLKETNFTISLVGGSWDQQIPANQQITFYKKWTHPRDVANFYSNCTIVLNTYRPYNESSNQNSHNVKNRSINNRTFEIASCRAFQISEQIDDLSNFFDVDKEIVTFEGEDDFLNKVNQYLQDEVARKRISDAAYEMVIRHHTFLHRIEEILNIIKGNARL